MNALDLDQLMLKIVVGSAWSDGQLDPLEVSYLHALIRRYGLEQDAELQVLLQEPIPKDQTEHWMLEYLSQADTEHRMHLLTALGNLLLADDRVSEEEHALLEEYHTLMAIIPPRKEVTPTFVSTLSSFLHKAIARNL
jgi:uncharacterized tellurite resistance protein B-like protein